MTPEALESLLTDIEKQCADVARALACGDALAVEPASDSLRRAALQLSDLMQQQGAVLRGRPGLSVRLRRVALDVSLQHAALLRWLSLAERSVGILVPSAAPKATYAAPAGRASLYRGFSS